MHSPVEGNDGPMPEREVRPMWAGAPAESHGVAAFAAASPDAISPAAKAVERQATWRVDIPAVRTVVKHTLSLGTLAAGLIEYTGWQIANRSSNGKGVVPLGEWALGTASNLGGAVAIGLGCACIAMVIAWAHKRPLRAGAAAFAFGVAGFLGFLALLTSRAF